MNPVSLTSQNGLQTQVTTSWGEENENWKLFVTRFFDCRFCWPDGADTSSWLSKCMTGYQQHFEFAYCRFARSLPLLTPPWKSAVLLKVIQPSLDNKQLSTFFLALSMKLLWPSLHIQHWLYCKYFGDTQIWILGHDSMQEPFPTQSNKHISKRKDDYGKYQNWSYDRIESRNVSFWMSDKTLNFLSFCIMWSSKWRILPGRSAYQFCTFFP